MSRRVAVTVVAFALLGAVSCEDITTQQRQTTLVVEISAGASPFLAAGDTLLGDTVSFTARLTDSGREVPIVSQQFSSTNPSVVEILNASTGDATFKSTGEATVRVTISDPGLQGTVDLQGQMDLRVTEYVPQFSLSSTVTGAAVPANDGLMGDIVRANVTVTKDGNAVTSSGVRIVSSSNTDVVDPSGATGADLALLKGEGTANLRITVDQPQIPGHPNRLIEGMLSVTVKPFVVRRDVITKVSGDLSLINGDTLVTDSVVFRATVVKAGNDTVKNFTSAGTRWTSSNPTVVRIVSDTMAVFENPGSALVSVEFDDLDLPGEPFGDTLRVSTFVRQVNIESNFAGPGPLADTLRTDSVTVTVAVTKNAQPRLSTVQSIETSDSLIVRPVTAIVNQAVFADTGQSWLWVNLSQPRLPRRALRDSVQLRVTTYLLTADSASSTTPVMGDTVQYFASVRDTRGDTLLTAFAANFTSADPSVVRLLNAGTGSGLARDTGTSTVSVTLTDPTLPNATLGATYIPTLITVERFYGQPSITSGDFRDFVTVSASELHKFTDSTRVFFPNGTIGYVDTATADTLKFFVGAGTNSGQLTLVNLVDDVGGARDTVLTRFSFSSAGTVDDPFEPNDAFPLADTDTVDLSARLPFDEILSMDPVRVPSDTNFFWISVPSGPGETFDVRAAWQQAANIDFFVCNGIGNPPTSYDDTACSRPKTANTSGPGDFVEEALNLFLGAGRHVFGFYCPAAGPCPALAVTYRVTVERQ